MREEWGSVKFAALRSNTPVGRPGRRLDFNRTS